MKELKAREYKRFEDIKQIRADGTEFWSARELAPALEYTKMGKSLMQDEVDNAKAANSVNADMMSVTQIHQKLEKGYADIENGNVEDAASAFAAFRERH